MAKKSVRKANKSVRKQKKVDLIVVGYKATASGVLADQNNFILTSTWLVM